MKKSFLSFIIFLITTWLVLNSIYVYIKILNSSVCLWLTPRTTDGRQTCETSRLADFGFFLLAWTLLPLLPTGPGGNPADPHSPTHPPTLHGHGHGVVLLRPPSSPHLLGLGLRTRSGAAVPCGVDWRSRGRHPSSIWTWVHLAFSLPLPGKESLPPLPSRSCSARSALDQKKISFLLASAQNEFFPPPSYFLSLHDPTPFSLPRIACHPGQYCVLYCEFMFDYLLLRYMWCGGTWRCFISTTCGSTL